MHRLTTPMIPPGVNHATRDGHRRAGTALSGRRKLSDVITQIQYFVAAEPRHRCQKEGGQPDDRRKKEMDFDRLTEVRRMLKHVVSSCGRRRFQESSSPSG